VYLESFINLCGQIGVGRLCAVGVGTGWVLWEAAKLASGGFESLSAGLRQLFVYAFCCSVLGLVVSTTHQCGGLSAKTRFRRDMLRVEMDVKPALLVVVGICTQRRLVTNSWQQQQQHWLLVKSFHRREGCVSGQQVWHCSQDVSETKGAWEATVEGWEWGHQYVELCVTFMSGTCHS